MFNMFSRNSLGEYDYNSIDDFIAGNLRELDYRNADTNNPLTLPVDLIWISQLFIFRILGISPMT